MQGNKQKEEKKPNKNGKKVSTSECLLAFWIWLYLLGSALTQNVSKPYVPGPHQGNYYTCPLDKGTLMPHTET